MLKEMLKHSDAATWERIKNLLIKLIKSYLSVTGISIILNVEDILCITLDFISKLPNDTQKFLILLCFHNICEYFLFIYNIMFRKF